MKYLMLLVAFGVFAIGRDKDESTYTIIARNPSADCAQLEIDNKFYTVTQAEIKKEVSIDKFDMASLSLNYTGTGNAPLTLSVYKGDKLVTTISGNTYMYIILGRDTTRKGGGGIYHHDRNLPQGDLYL